MGTSLFSTFLNPCQCRMMYYDLPTLQGQTHKSRCRRAGRAVRARGCRLQHSRSSTRTRHRQDILHTVAPSRAYFFDSRTKHDNSQARRDSREASFLSTPRQGWGRPPGRRATHPFRGSHVGMRSWRAATQTQTRGSTMPPTLPFEGASLVPCAPTCSRGGTNTHMPRVPCTLCT